MGAHYALLVGIDTYLDPRLPRLSGCRTDVHDASRFLSARRADGTKLDVALLLDHEATGAAIVDGFRSQFAAAGAR